jgi:O-antigen ligase
VVFSVASLFCALIALDRDVHPVIRGVCIIFVFGFVSSILFASSGRSGYLFLLVIAMGLGYRLFPRWRMAGALGFLVIACLALISSDTARQRILLGFTEIKTAYTTKEDHSSLGMRIVMWNNTISMIAESPFLGTGAGGYSIGYQRILTNETGWRATVTDDPHQQYLHITAEYGGIALLVFLAFLAASIWTGPRDIYVFSGLVVLVGTIANGFANGHFSSFVEGRLVWLVLGAMIADSSCVSRFVKRWA